MKLIFLGSGSAFTVGGNYHSNMVLESVEKKRLLIDCGSDARHSLYEAGLTYKDIEAVYISHLHADHAGGLEWLGFNAYFDSTCEKPTLYIAENLIDDLWNEVLRGGLNSLKDRKAELSTFFHVISIPSGGDFQWHEYKIQLVKTKHTCADQIVLPSYGIFITDDKHSFFISGDTQFTPEILMPFYQKADLIFHDCEISTPPSGVHSQYHDLKTLASDIKKKMWLYHYQSGPLPAAKEEGFCGFVKKGDVFD